MTTYENYLRNAEVMGTTLTLYAPERIEISTNIDGAPRTAFVRSIDVIRALRAIGELPTVGEFPVTRDVGKNGSKAFVALVTSAGPQRIDADLIAQRFGRVHADQVAYYLYNEDCNIWCSEPAF